MRSEFLPFCRHALGEEEIAEVVDTLRSAWITTGPKTRRFEQEFAAFLEAPGALALSSCTAALHVALVAARVAPGDDVVTTPMTFAATANVVEHVGARVVLADVEPDTLNLDPAAAEAALTPRTRAIIVVHYAGHPAELDALADLAACHGLVLIEDAAHALPARYRGRPIGAGGNPVAFSFYATKNLTTGEGGMLTATPELLEAARPLALHGMTSDAWRRYERGGAWSYEVRSPGFKYNMSDIQASLGLWQLRKLTQFQERRRRIVAAYTEAFAGQPAFEPPVERPEVQHAWHLYPLRLRDDALRIGRDRFLEELAARNIGASVHFIPIHVHPYYRERYGWRPADFPVAHDAFRRILSLPVDPRLGDADVADVIEAVLDVARVHRR